MANIIEIIYRGIDQNAAPARAVQQSLKGLNSETAATTGGLGGLGSALRGLISPAALAAAAIAGTGAAVMGLFNAGKGFAAEVEQLDNLSARLGVAVPNLQALNFAFRQQGLAGGEAVMAMQFLNREIATGNPLLKELKITTRDTWSAFVQLVQILARSPDAAARTAVAMSLMGRGAGESLGALRKIADELPTMVAELQKAGIVSTESELALAREVDKVLDEAAKKMARIQGWIKVTGARAILAASAVPGAVATGTQSLINPDVSQRAALEQRAKMAYWLEERGLRIPELYRKARIEVERLEAAEAAAAETARRAADESARLAAAHAAQADVDPAAALAAGERKKTAAARAKAQAEAEAKRDKAAVAALTWPERNAVDVIATRLTPSEIAIRRLAREYGELSELAVSVSQSLESSIVNIFGNFTNKMQTIGSAAKLFWDDLVSSILKSLARLIINKWLASFLMSFGGANAGWLGKLIGGIGGELAGKNAAAPSRSPASSAGSTYIFNGLNTRDMFMQIAGPGGEFRRAQDRVAMGRAY